MGDEKKSETTPKARRGPSMTRGGVRLSRVLAILLLLTLPRAAAGWGPEGHVIVTRTALAASDGLPRWFREAGDALAELSNAPDRWREVEKDAPALASRSPDHFFDLDVWGEEPLPPERWASVERAARRRLRPAAIGFLPFAIGEEYGVLLGAFRDVQAGRAGGREAALAAAGVLAHLAGDAAVPLHATRHHHGWVGPNPEGFTRAGDIHQWFESALVARIDPAEVRAWPEAARALRDVPGAVRAILGDSLAQVPRLYRLERESRDTHDDASPPALARARLPARAPPLAPPWLTASVRSGWVAVFPAPPAVHSRWLRAICRPELRGAQPRPPAVLLLAPV